MTPKLKWRFRLSLRSVFILVFICAVALAIVGQFVRRAQRQREIVERLERDGNSVGYEEPPRWVPERLYKQVGADFFCRVDSVATSNEPRELRLLSELPSIKLLSLDVAPELAPEAGAIIASLPTLEVMGYCSPAILPYIRGKKTLKSLLVTNWGRGDSEYLTADERDALASLVNLNELTVTLSDDDFEAIKSLRHLKDLHILGGPVSAGLLHFKEFKQLRDLRFGYDACNDTTLRYVAELPNLEWLSVVDSPKSPITNDGVKWLIPLPHLRVLILDTPLIDDEAIPHFEKMIALEGLKLASTRISPLGVKRLKAARPSLQMSIK